MDLIKEQNGDAIKPIIKILFTYIHEIDLILLKGNCRRSDGGIDQ